VSIRRSSIVLATAGLVLIVLAGLVRYVIVPIETELPANADLTAHYSGTATLLNGSALKSGDLAHLIEPDVPITVDRRVQVTGTYGDTAIVKDSLAVHAGGQTLPSSHTYALNRTTLDGATAPAGITVEPSKGALSSAFPIGAKANDSYTYYDPTTRAIVPIRYAGSAERGGRSVNVYKISVSGPVNDPALLTTLPRALPKSDISALAPSLPAAVKAQFTPATVAALPNPVPVTYTGTTSITAYVDKQTGVAIGETISEQVVVNAALGTQHVSLLPVLAFDFHLTPASVSYLAGKARSAGLLLTLISVIAPIALLVIGIVLLLVAFLRRRRPQQPGTSRTDTQTRTPSPLSNEAE
jgi:hypothetical protein